MRKINRNDQCPCGSGKKFKKCCGLTEVKQKKGRLGGSIPFPQGGIAKKKGATNLAQRVFKVLSSSSEGSKNVTQSVKEEEPIPAKGYSSLEELIGIEGAPNNEPPALPK